MAKGLNVDFLLQAKKALNFNLLSLSKREREMTEFLSICSLDFAVDQKFP